MFTSQHNPVLYTCCPGILTNQDSAYGVGRSDIDVTATVDSEIRQAIAHTGIASYTGRD